METNFVALQFARDAFFIIFNVKFIFKRASGDA